MENCNLLSSALVQRPQLWLRRVQAYEELRVRCTAGEMIKGQLLLFRTEAERTVCAGPRGWR